VVSNTIYINDILINNQFGALFSETVSMPFDYSQCPRISIFAWYIKLP